ncbi:Uncharacterised protein [Vibrio cholerae]|nr:Uncharacterised protein [Vibrio cholerae]
MRNYRAHETATFVDGTPELAASLVNAAHQPQCHRFVPQ